MEFVVRVKHSNELEEKIKSQVKHREELSEIKDRFYKPIGTDLTDFSPKDVIIRKRTFPDRETLVKINIIQKTTGYTDTKEEIDSLEDYEKWGEFNSYAVEYKLKIDEEEIPILVEEFDFGKYIKMEAPSEEMLENLLEELSLDREEMIEKNSAELLAENSNKI